MDTARLSADELRTHAVGLRRVARRIAGLSDGVDSSSSKRLSKRMTIEHSYLELSARVELQRVVIEELLALPRPHRDAALFHYFGEFPVIQASAAQIEQDAFELLRRRLERRSLDDRTAWTSSLQALVLDE